MTVKIDRYESIISNNGKSGWIKDRLTDDILVKVDMPIKEHTSVLISYVLDKLNTGEFEDDI